MSQQSRTKRFEQSFSRIEQEIVPNYIEGCIHWVDTIYDGAWSAISERFERGLSKYLAGNMRELDYDIEEDMMIENMKSYMDKYRTYKKLDDKQEFINSFSKEKYQYGY